ncbi:hypothetical protein [Jatrophihabitans sp.]|uniref:hypothetical protein n=1 Tax=Jatrophihabitans sp. TaxID=1932789 RepID=UPI002BAF3ABE|nr:hypothetical protein [Jatrophihabitans sp.]
MPDSVWLVLGQVGLGFAGLEEKTSHGGYALRLPDPPSDPPAVVWLKYDDIVADELAWCPGADGQGGEQQLPALTGRSAVWSGAAFDVRAQALRLGNGTDRPAPTFLVFEQPDGGAGRVRRTVYACSRMRESGLLFGRIGEDDTDQASPLLASVERVAQAHPAVLRRMSDESRQTTKFFPDTEIELKFTFESDVSPWVVTSDLAAAVQRRELPDFIPDVGNEYQRWSYEQDTFALERDGVSVGYAAFMLTPSQEYVVKYKMYPADGLRRQETFDMNVRLEPSDFQDYLRTALPGTTASALAHLTRSRFDVNVQSARTGHYFGLEMDEVTAAGHTLRQLELEYHRSQLVAGCDQAAVEPELMRLRDLVAGVLSDRGYQYSVGYLSKLSFLKGLPVPAPG